MAVTLLAGSVAVSAPATAQVRTDDRVAAESLFSDARQLMLAGKYQQACEKFAASRALEPALGATLNLADCYEKLGRTASAWVEFKSAAAEAHRVGDGARKATAQERATALEPKLSRLWLQSDDPGITVLRNGEAVRAGVLGNAIPVDPGSHELEARAPGKATWTQTVQVAGEGAVVEVRIPALADLGGAPQVVMTGDSSGGTRRTLAWVSGGVGVAAAAGGVVFGLLASSNWSKAEKSCEDFPYECTPEGLSDADTASTQATVATVAFAVGGVALGASVILFVTDSDADESSAELALEPTRLSLRGRF